MLGADVLWEAPLPAVGLIGWLAQVPIYLCIWVGCPGNTKGEIEMRPSAERRLCLLGRDQILEPCCATGRL